MEINCLILIHVERELFEYIEQFCIGQRLHATLGYISPVQFEALSRVKCA